MYYCILNTYRQTATARVAQRRSLTSQEAWNLNYRQPQPRTSRENPLSYKRFSSTPTGQCPASRRLQLLTFDRAIHLELDQGTAAVEGDPTAESTGVPNILSEKLRGFPKSLQINDLIVPSTFKTLQS